MTYRELIRHVWHDVRRKLEALFRRDNLPLVLVGYYGVMAMATGCGLTGALYYGVQFDAKGMLLVAFGLAALGLFPLAGYKLMMRKTKQRKPK